MISKSKRPPIFSMMAPKVWSMFSASFNVGTMIETDDWRV
jgi:hypothetical protein